jgi:hypothetical protein
MVEFTSTPSILHPEKPPRKSRKHRTGHTGVDTTHVFRRALLEYPLPRLFGEIRNFITMFTVLYH